MSREDLERQFNLQYKDKTPEEMLKIGEQVITESANKEKQNHVAKVGALRALFNTCNILPSERLKK